MINLKLINVFKVCVVSIFIILSGCKDNKNPAGPDKENPLAGTWMISHMRTEYQGNIETFTKAQLDSMGLIWSLSFEDDVVEQTTNISGPIVIIPGTWETSDEQLTLTLTGPTSGISTLIYEYSIDGNILKLNWQLPAGTKFYAEFSKQQ